ncbi:Epsin-3, clathrin recruitment and traffic between the Golgi and endosome [Puccinia graminis f. sp. tritici]|uniref:Epsin-3, clathrin recruitment and traffic between the Golgi and endosome n=1 Tax=Puccinia graminis f. sp. tritici TaxID=56615 RepID=A0A5B0RQ38_PUCGR|nr:Epsin-3, clathrin recruitment and traffic between the Golgi and endosome [Puccinia graminis f. sp. tritici]
MDKIEALGSSIAQISLYDIKSYYNQAKAVVLNYTEMEAKVRDATNDDPWGASSTVMQEIAQGTFNFQQFNEIMPTIYKRFTEKEAREWRQIYKALQLLEYLIKHGSERVIDDARSHISMIKILRNFHYVDDKGKDQGINVRNRAKEIAELLSDLDRVRQERRKAKAAKNKYIGVGSEGPSFSTSGGSKYGGFGSDSLGGGGGGGGDDWNGGGSSSRDQYASGSSTFKQSDDFEEYDAGEWEDRPAAGASRTSPSTARGSISSNRAPSISVSMKKPAQKATAPPPKAKEVDLFSMGDDDDFASPAAPSSTKPAASENASISLDDEFDDFQSAPPASNFGATSPPPATGASSGGYKPNVFELLSATPSAPAPMSNTGGSSMFGGNTNSMSSQPAPVNANMFGSSMMQPMMMNNNQAMNAQAARPGQYGNTTPMSSNTNSTSANARGTSSAKPAGGDQFDDLFSFAGLTNSKSSTAATGANGKPAQAKLSMAAMAREQSSASIWGAALSTSAAKPPVGMGAPMGSAAPSAASGSASMGDNNDDLLL